MSNIWKRIKLQNVCERVTVGHVGKTSAYYCDDGVKFLRTQNVGKDGLKLNDVRFITPEFHRSLKKSQLVVGDVLISRVVTDDMRCAIVPPELEPANCANIILLRPGSELNSRYLYHLINSPYAQKYLLDRRVGSAQQVVNTKILKNWEIPVPSLCEQERIVAILDEAFAGIATAVANTEKNLANARELFESYLNAVLSQQGEGWTQKTLVELCDIARGGSPRPIKAFLTNDPDGVNWIKISDATASSKFIYETKQKIRREGVRRSRMVHEGDLLLSNSMSFGRPYIMKTSGCIHDGWLVLSDKSGLYAQEYLYYFLGSSDAYRQFDSRASGSTVRNLNIDLVRTVRVPVPPLDKQHEIASNLEDLGAECNRLESLYHQKSDALAELKQALLQKAFSGELTTAPQDEIEIALA